MTGRLSNEQIDALIAETVMGWKRRPYLYGKEGWLCDDPIVRMFVDYWYPTQDIAQAWQVLETFERDNCDIFVSTELKGWRCIIETTDNGYTGYGDTAPMAICKCALKAVGVSQVIDILPATS